MLAMAGEDEQDNQQEQAKQEPKPLWESDEGFDFGSMSLGDHLDELRRRLIRALAGFVLCTCFTLYYGNEIIWWLNQPLLQIQRFAGLTPQTYTFAVAEYFMVYIKVSLIAGLILASPLVLYQGWQFVATGLYKSERKAILLLTPFSAVLTTMGVLFAYYILLPVCLAFLLLFAVAAPPAGEAHSSFIERITSAYAEADEREDAHNAAEDAANQLELIDPADDEAADPPADAMAQVEDETAAGDDGSADGLADAQADMPASVVLLPRLTADPIRPGEGEIWVKMPEEEVRLHIAGQTRVVSLTASSGVAPMIGVSQYIGFASLIMLAVVIAFQLPLVMLIIGWTGLVDPALIRQYRKHCSIACFVAGALLTPADPISMIVMAIPLLILFEAGMVCMKWAYRKRVPALPDIE